MPYAAPHLKPSGTESFVPGPMDARNIAVLYERYAPAIYAHCRRLLGSAPAGRDALQESFVRVLQHHQVLGPGIRRCVICIGHPRTSASIF